MAASVISADGKEGFYQRCGFDVGPVGWSGEGGEGNPLKDVPGGYVFVRENRGVREGEMKEREGTRRLGVGFGGQEVEFM